MEKTIKIPKENAIKKITVFQVVMGVILSIYTISIIVPLIVAINCSLSPNVQVTELGALNPFWNHTWVVGDKVYNIFEKENNRCT